MGFPFSYISIGVQWGPDPILQLLDEIDQWHEWECYLLDYQEIDVFWTRRVTIPNVYLGVLGTWNIMFYFYTTRKIIHNQSVFKITLVYNLRKGEFSNTYHNFSRNLTLDFMDI